MARRKRAAGTPVRADSKLNLALKSGRSIKGLTGFVNICDDGDPVYAKVSCVGFTAMDDGDCSCSTDLKIRGTVVGTGSVITFSACNWLDTLKEVEADSDLNRRKAKAHREYKAMVNHHYLARKRLALQAFILDALSAADRTAINADISERKLTITTLNDVHVKDYARKAALVANSVSPDEAERYYD